MNYKIRLFGLNNHGGVVEKETFSGWSDDLGAMKKIANAAAGNNIAKIVDETNTTVYTAYPIGTNITLGKKATIRDYATYRQRYANGASELFRFPMDTELTVLDVHGSDCLVQGKVDEATYQGWIAKELVGVYE